MRHLKEVRNHKRWLPQSPLLECKNKELLFLKVFYVVQPQLLDTSQLRPLTVLSSSAIILTLMRTEPTIIFAADSHFPVKYVHLAAGFPH